MIVPKTSTQEISVSGQVSDTYQELKLFMLQRNDKDSE